MHEILTKDINIDIIPGQLGKQIERPHLGSYHLRDTSYIVATIYLFIYFFDHVMSVYERLDPTLLYKLRIIIYVMFCIVHTRLFHA